MAPPHRIDVHIDPAFRHRADAELLADAVRHTLDSRRLRRPRAVSLRLADTRTVRRLNARYLGLDEPTDVLAFNTDIPGLHDPSGVAELGALIIAVPVAARGARARGVPLADELSLLAVHGVLAPARLRPRDAVGGHRHASRGASGAGTAGPSRRRPAAALEVA